LICACIGAISIYRDRQVRESHQQDTKAQRAQTAEDLQEIKANLNELKHDIALHHDKHIPKRQENQTTETRRTLFQFIRKGNQESTQEFSLFGQQRGTQVRQEAANSPTFLTPSSLGVGMRS